MKKLTTAILLLAFSISSKAGDTTWVQTFTFDSLWTRDAKFFFPTAGQSYRKILMYTTLKCYPSVSGDNNYPCGEWDGVSYHSVYDHRGVLDSTIQTGKLFSVNGQYPDSVRYTVVPQYDRYQSYQHFKVITSTNALNTFQSGSGNVAQAAALPLAGSTGHAQFIWNAADLTAAGLTAGPVTGIRLQCSGSSGTIERLKIRMRHVYTDSFQTDAFIPDTLTTVFFYRKAITAAGWQDFQFTQPFVWNGTDAVLIDFSFDNPGPQTDNPLLGTNTTWPAGISVSGSSYCTGNTGKGVGFIQLGKALNLFSGTQPRTYEIWALVDTAGTLWASGGTWQNYGNYSLRATGGNQWNLTTWGSSSPVFATPNPQKVWKHYAVTYDGTTIRVYQNGVSAAQANATINTTLTADFRLGGWHENGGDLLGRISHLRIWNKALDAATIRAWLGKDVTPAHPDYAFLKGDYPLNEGSSAFVTDRSPLHQPPGAFQYDFWWQQVKAGELYYNAQRLHWRPNIIFERGDYVSHTDSVLITDTVQQAATILDMYDNADALHIIDDSSAVHPAIRTGRKVIWDGPWSYTYRNGTRVDSIAVTRDSLLYNRTKTWYSNTVAYEIGRAITPYGINLDMGNGRTWVYDVTDYYPILQDTVHFSSGTTQELQDVRFAFIKGDPPAVVTHIGQPWFKGSPSLKYAGLADNSIIQPAQITLQPGTDRLLFRARLTGHGAETSNPGGAWPHCCEFWENTHYLYAGSRQITSWHIFRECGYNPLYPQGGTWTTPREGWCPGDVVPEKIIYVDLSQYATGRTISLDYGISPVPAGNPAMGNGGYVTSLQAIEYAAPGRHNDAELYDIISPADQFYTSRVNPVCNNPVIVLRNAGSNVLTAAVIRYSVSGGAPETYTWKGSLRFLETDTVALPLSGPAFWGGDQRHIFTAIVTGANSTADEYAGNDTIAAHYNIPDNYNMDKIVIAFKTNSTPADNVLTVRNFAGDTIFIRANTTANQLYTDTLQLPVGSYYLTLTDEGQDGLSFWANPGQGRGYLQLRSSRSPASLKSFNPDFGAEIYYPFTMGFPLQADNITAERSIAVYPNPNNGAFYLRIEGYTGRVSLTLTNVLGQQVMSDAVTCNGSVVEKQYNLSLAKGIYLLRSDDGHTTSCSKIIIGN